MSAENARPSAEKDRPADYVTARPRPTDDERAAIMRAIAAAKARVIPPAKTNRGQS